MNKENIFPFMLARIAGISFDEIEKLSSKKLNDTILGIDLEKKNLKRIAESLNNELYALIQSSSSNFQKVLLNIKRDVFNNRDIKENELAFVKEILPLNIEHQISSYSKIKGAISGKTNKYYC